MSVEAEPIYSSLPKAVSFFPAAPDSLISSYHFERCLSLDIKLCGNLDLETCPLVKVQTSSKATLTGLRPTVPGASEDQSYLNHSAHKESSVCLVQMARVTVWFFVPPDSWLTSDRWR